MSIERDGKDYTLYCDECKDPTYTSDDFNDVLDYKKHHKWQSRCIGGEWTDVCPECREIKNGD